MQIKTMVIGFGPNAETDIDKHRAPGFGQTNEYVQDIDITPEIRARFQRSSMAELNFLDFARFFSIYEVVNHNEEPNLEGCHADGYIKLDEIGGVDKVIKRANPIGKWVAWHIGGAWNDALITHAGDSVAKAKKGDISFDAVVDRAGREAEKLWRDNDRKKGKKDDIGALEDFVKACRDAALIPYAWIDLDGKFHDVKSLDRMYEFDEESVKEFNDYVAMLGDDVEITVFECIVE